MEPLKINVEVSLSENTIAALRGIAIAISSVMMSNNLDKHLSNEEDKEKVAEAIVNQQRDLQESIITRKAEEAAPAEETAASTESNSDLPGDLPGDLPEDDAISDDELIDATRKAVSGVKAKGKSPVFIRTEIFAKYGISESKACPQEHRRELIDELKKLW